MTITKKIIFGQLSILAICGLVGILMVNSNYQNRTMFEKLKYSEKLVMNLSKTKEALLNTTLGYMDAIVDKDSGQVIKEIKEKHEAFPKFLKEHDEELTEAFAHYDLSKLKTEMLESLALYSKAGTNLIQDIENKKLDNLGQYDDDIDGTNEKQLEVLTNIIERADHDFQDTEKSFTNLQTTLDYLTFFIFLLAISTGLIITYFLTKSVSTLLGGLTTSLGQNSSSLKASSDELTIVSKTLSETASGQASSLQESAAVMEEINSTVAQNAESSKISEANALACEAKARSGSEAVKEMIDAVTDIDTSNKEIMSEISDSNKKFAEIIDVIRAIGEKTRVINDIVFQTKLLSFNASVEAARAGEHGKGFAVVAEEVGNLAAMSGTASQEISEMLNQSIQKVQAIVSQSTENIGRLTLTSQGKVEKGVTTAEECDRVLKEIVETVSLVRNSITEIARATTEQSSGIAEVTRELNHLSLNTEKTNKYAQDCSQTAVQLHSGSAELEKIVSILNVHVGNLKSTKNIAESPTTNRTNSPLGFMKSPVTSPSSTVEKSFELKLNNKADFKIAPKPSSEKKPKLTVVKTAVSPLPPPKLKVPAPKLEVKKSAPKPLPPIKTPQESKSEDNGIPSANDPRFEDL